MAELTPRERIIRTLQDTADALTDEFLRNADVGANEDNDRLVEALIEHKRKRRIGD